MAWDQRLNHLRDVLADLYPEARSARRVVDEADLPGGHITLDGTPTDMWHGILTEAEKRYKMEDLIDVARRDYPESQNLIRAVRELEGGWEEALPPNPFGDQGRLAGSDVRLADEVFDAATQSDSADAPEASGDGDALAAATDQGAVPTAEQFQPRPTHEPSPEPQHQDREKGVSRFHYRQAIDKWMDDLGFPPVDSGLQGLTGLELERRLFERNHLAAQSESLRDAAKEVITEAQKIGWDLTEDEEALTILVERLLLRWHP